MDEIEDQEKYNSTFNKQNIVIASFDEPWLGITLLCMMSIVLCFCFFATIYNFWYCFGDVCYYGKRKIKRFFKCCYRVIRGQRQSTVAEVIDSRIEEIGEDHSRMGLNHLNDTYAASGSFRRGDRQREIEMLREDFEARMSLNRVTEIRSGNNQWVRQLLHEQ